MLEAVGEIGYEGTAVRTVLDRTELYRQAFYDNFSSKEDCYLQAYDAALKRVEAGIRAAAAGEDSWCGQLRAGLGALLDFLDTEPNVGRALIVEVHPAGPPALAKREAALARARGFLDQGRAAAATGTNGREPPRLAPEGIASGIHMVVYSRLAAGEEGGLRALLPELMYVAVLPYLGPQAARQELALV
ncbi:MAG TPA: TetR/AcrR family transcriptional regulator [Solirubrobacterales bacterium]|nr:TetR/AcrR family transcriptional regulator [Solirubrobacterales bacterium]